MSDKKSEKCPNCGYCPHCGQAPQRLMPPVYWPYPYPWYVTPIVPNYIRPQWAGSTASTTIKLFGETL